MPDIFKILENSFTEPKLPNKWYLDDVGRDIVQDAFALLYKNQYGEMEREDSFLEVIKRLRHCTIASIPKANKNFFKKVFLSTSHDNDYDNIGQALEDDMFMCAFAYDDTIVKNLGKQMYLEGKANLVRDSHSYYLNEKEYDAIKEELDNSVVFLDNVVAAVKAEDLKNEEKIESLAKIIDEYNAGRVKYTLLCADADSWDIFSFINKINCIAKEKKNDDVTVSVYLDDPHIDEIIAYFEKETILNLEFLIHERMEDWAIAEKVKTFVCPDNPSRIGLSFVSKDIEDIDTSRRLSTFNHLMTHVLVGHINLSSFTKEDPSTGEKFFDLISLSQLMYRATTYLDILAARYNNKGIYTTINLVFDGFAETLIADRIEYDTGKSYNTITGLASSIDGIATIISVLKQDKNEHEYEWISKIYSYIFKDIPLKTDNDYLKLFFDVFNGTITLNDLPHVKDAALKSYFNKFFYSSIVIVKFNSLKEEDIRSDPEYSKKIVNFARRLLSGKMKYSSLIGMKDVFSTSYVMGVTPSISPLLWINMSDSKGVKMYMHNRLFRDLGTSPEYADIIHGKAALPKYWRTFNKIDYADRICIYSVFESISDILCEKDMYVYADTAKEGIQNFVALCRKYELKNVTINSYLALPSSDESEKTEDTQSEEKAADTMESKTEELQDSFDDNFATDMVNGETHLFDPYDKRPLVLSGFTERTSTPFGSMYLIANHDKNKIMECFIKLGKSGSDIQSLIEAIARLISVGLQNGVGIDTYISTLAGIRGKTEWKYAAEGKEEVDVYSIPDLISKVLANLNSRF